jgi:beta-N-acetylhexosaminidase
MRATGVGGRRLWYAAAAVLFAVGAVIVVVRETADHPSRAPHSSARPTGRVQPSPATGRRMVTRPTGGVPTARGPDAAHMLGQMIVARFHGSVPSASLLTRIRRGQVGGVILFGDNTVGGAAATRRLTGRLQRAAAEGGNPPLLIMTDQEGGVVRRLPGPPSLAPASMASTGVARRQGQAAGQLLRSAGIDLDLAPVADVEGVAGSFLGSRAFSDSPATVAQRACAFAGGLASQGVGYTLKHFPGLGLATGNTDLGSVSVQASPAALRSDYRAYQACGGQPLAVVMVSSASYPTLSGPLPAVMSPTIYSHELPLATPAGSPVTISDDLESPAIASQSAPARHAIQAGLDLLMYAQTEQASASAYAKLLAEVRSGAISRARLAAADRRIRALKGRLGR